MDSFLVYFYMSSTGRFPIFFLSWLKSLKDGFIGLASGEFRVVIFSVWVVTSSSDSDASIVSDSLFSSSSLLSTRGFFLIGFFFEGLVFRVIPNFGAVFLDELELLKSEVFLPNPNSGFYVRLFLLDLYFSSSFKNGSELLVPEFVGLG